MYKATGYFVGLWGFLLDFCWDFLKISQLICTELSEQGLFFRASHNESKKCCAMIKIDKKLKCQWILNQSAPNFQNRTHVSESVEMSPRSAML